MDVIDAETAGRIDCAVSDDPHCADVLADQAEFHNDDDESNNGHGVQVNEDDETADVIVDPGSESVCVYSEAEPTCHDASDDNQSPVSTDDCDDETASCLNGSNTGDTTSTSCHPDMDGCQGVSSGIAAAFVNQVDWMLRRNEGFLAQQDGQFLDPLVYCADVPDAPCAGSSGSIITPEWLDSLDPWLQCADGVGSCDGTDATVQICTGWSQMALLINPAVDGVDGSGGEEPPLPDCLDCEI